MTPHITPTHHLAYLQDKCCVRRLHVSGPGLMQALQKALHGHHVILLCVGVMLIVQQAKRLALLCARAEHPRPCSCREGRCA